MSDITVEIIDTQTIEIDFANPVFENHNHNDIYYSKSQTNTLLDGKQDKNSYINGGDF